MVRKNIYSRAPLPRNWRRIRTAVMERDGHRCTAILADGTRCACQATDVHHIGNRDDHSIGNLTALCAWHHGRITSAQGNSSRGRVSQHRPPEKHPGVMG